MGRWCAVVAPRPAAPALRPGAARGARTHPGGSVQAIEIGADPQQWRDLYPLFIGLVTPRPIALVSTVSATCSANLAPFSFYNLVSAQPPVVIFGPANRPDGSAEDTLRNIEATGEFVIAAVTEDI